MKKLGADGAPIEVLLVEDNPGDARITKEAFREANEAINLHISCDGVEAMSFLLQDGAHEGSPRPDIILLDLDMPRMDGRELLAQIKAHESLRLIPVVVLTVSEAESDIVKSFELNASCYLTKPVQLAEFKILVNSINDFWFTHATMPNEGPTASCRVAQ